MGQNVVQNEGSLVEFLDHQETSQGSVNIVLTREIDFTQAAEIRKTCQQLAQDGIVCQQFDLRYIARLDTIGIGVLLGLRAHLKAKGGMLNIVNASEFILETLAQMKLDSVFDCDLDF